MRASGGRKAGLGAVELLVFVSLAALVLALSVPSLIESRKRANESEAVQTLRGLAAAEAVFRDTDRENDGRLDYGMLSELGSAGLVDPALGSGTKSGYTFQASYSFTTSEFLWFGVANPLLPGGTADRSFAVERTGVVYYSTGPGLALDTSSAAIPDGCLRVGD